MTATDRAYKNARRFRRGLSLPELLLWKRLKVQEIKFRRQHPVGSYVLDFYCPAARLAIEVDGEAHNMGDRPERDEVRSKWLKGEAIDMLRIVARDVLVDPDAVADGLVRYCEERIKPLHHSATPSGPPPHSFGAGRSD